MLQFIVDRAVMVRPSITALPRLLSGVKGAAGIQFGAVSALVRELQAGLEMVKEELAMDREEKREEVEQNGQQGEAFPHLMPHQAPLPPHISEFVALHEAECAALGSIESECMAALRGLCEGYFGDTFDAKVRLGFHALLFSLACLEIII